MSFDPSKDTPWDDKNAAKRDPLLNLFGENASREFEPVEDDEDDIPPLTEIENKGGQPAAVHRNELSAPELPAKQQDSPAEVNRGRNSRESRPRPPQQPAARAASTKPAEERKAPSNHWARLAGMFGIRKNPKPESEDSSQDSGDVAQPVAGNPVDVTRAVVEAGTGDRGRENREKSERLRGDSRAGRRPDREPRHGSVERQVQDVAAPSPTGEEIEKAQASFDVDEFVEFDLEELDPHGRASLSKGAIGIDDFDEPVRSTRTPEPVDNEENRAPRARTRRDRSNERRSERGDRDRGERSDRNRGDRDRGDRDRQPRVPRGNSELDRSSRGNETADFDSSERPQRFGDRGADSPEERSGNGRQRQRGRRRPNRPEHSAIEPRPSTFGKSEERADDLPINEDFEDTELAPGLEEDSEKPRRRRRRRGKKSGPAGNRDVAVPANAEDDFIDEQDESDLDSPGRRGKGHRDDEGGGAESRRKRVSITTWSEAINAVIDKSLAKRKSSPQGGGRGRGDSRRR